MLFSDKWNAEMHENQGGVGILIVLLHVFGIVLCRLALVHGVEIELGVVVLDQLEVHPESLLDAVWSQLFVLPNRFCISKTYQRGSMLTSFALSSPPIIVPCPRGCMGEQRCFWMVRRRECESAQRLPRFASPGVTSHTVMVPW